MALAMPTKTDLLNTADYRRTDLPIKGGRIRTTLSFMTTDAWPKAISHSLRCRDTYSRQSNWRHAARVAWDLLIGRAHWKPTPKDWRKISKLPFGALKSEAMPWRSTAAKIPAVSDHRMPARSCLVVSPATSAR